MPKGQRTFTEEFKLGADRLVQTSGKSNRQIARDLGIAESTLHHWCRVFAQQGDQAFPESRASDGKGARRSASACRRLETVRQERDMLKKVVSIYSRETR